MTEQLSYYRRLRRRWAGWRSGEHAAMAAEVDRLATREATRRQKTQ